MTWEEEKAELKTRGIAVLDEDEPIDLSHLEYIYLTRETYDKIKTWDVDP